MKDLVDYSDRVGRSIVPETTRSSLGKAIATAAGAAVSIYFVIVAFCIYWLAYLPAAAVTRLVPARLLERFALPLLVLTAIAAAALTQTIDGFFPDYSNPLDILAELALWCGVGVFARCYLAYTKQPATFDDVKASIATRWPDRWFAANLHNPLDAAFTRIVIGNAIAMVPVTVLLLLPASLNYLVVALWSAALLLVLFPQELIEHTHMHNRIFTPRIGSTPRVKRILAVCQWIFEYPVTLLTIRIPEFYRIQHVYIHHVEGNGPDDTQSTMAFDRTSFLDYSRHALLQGLDLLTGCLVIPYLRRKGKNRQIRELLQGLAVFYAIVAIVAVFNPIAAGLIVASRLLGGQILSFFAFFQHGLIDARDVKDVHGNTVNYDGDEHGHLGADFHVEHHLKPARHWSTYSDAARKETEAHEEGHRAIVIDKSFYSPLGMIRALWKRDYLGVATVAQVRGFGSDTGKIAAEIWERTRPIGQAERTGYMATLDRWLGQLMGRALPTDLRVGP
jgi:hypothetical protein